MGIKLSTNEKKSGNKYVDKHKQIRSSRQNDKLEQWVMQTAVKDVVLGSILGSNKQKVFFHLKLSALYRLSNPICFIIDHFTVRSRNPSKKAKTVETVGSSKFRRTVVINKRIGTKSAVWRETHATTSLGNQSQA